MAVNGVDALNQGYTVKLQKRGKKSSGITFELKNVFAEMQKDGKIEDIDGKGLTKKDAQNLYAELNKIHEQTHKATNYKKMRAGQEFNYTADEMQAMAKAAGYKIIDTAAQKIENQDEGDENNQTKPPQNENVEETKQKTIENVVENGGKVIKRNVDGLKKQDIAIYKQPESKVKVRRAFNENGELSDPLVQTNKFGNKRYITLQEDERSNNLGEMKLKKVKIDGNKEKELIVAGKTTDETAEKKYYRLIPKVGHPDSDGQNNRLGEEVFKVKGKYVTEKPEETVAEKPKKKGFFQRLFGKKDKTPKDTPGTKNFEENYKNTQTTIAQTINSEMEPDKAMQKIFGIKPKKVDKMLKEIGKYSQKHDITTPEGKQEVYKIAAKYGVDPGTVQAFLDSLT